MAKHLVTGLFVVIEGADGSGKTAVVDQLVPDLARAGRVVRRIDRGRPDGEAAHADVVRAVDRLFRSEKATDAGWEYLSLAAAVQYRSIVHAQVAPAVAAGEIVVAESWWDKTWIRLGTEAASVCDHSPERQRAFTGWQRTLQPPGLPPDRQLTVHIDTPERDRVNWYRTAGCPDPYLDHTGTRSRDPAGYGRFTEVIASRLREVAVEQHRPTIRNGRDRTVAEVVAKLHRLITDRLNLSV